MFDDITKLGALCALTGVLFCLEPIFAATQIVEEMSGPGSDIYCPYGLDPKDHDCDYTDEITPYRKITWIQDVPDSDSSNVQTHVYDSDSVAFSYSNVSYWLTECVNCSGEGEIYENITVTVETTLSFGAETEAKFSLPFNLCAGHVGYSLGLERAWAKEVEQGVKVWLYVRCWPESSFP